MTPCFALHVLHTFLYQREKDKKIKKQVRSNEDASEGRNEDKIARRDYSEFVLQAACCRSFMLQVVLQVIYKVFAF